MVQGVLFDMDGVLFDTERPCAQIDKDVTRRMGREMPDALVQKLYGANAALVRRHILDYYGEDFDYEKYISMVHIQMDEYIATHGLTLMPGVQAALEWLRRQNLPMAVASSTETGQVKRNLQQAGLAGYFSAVVGGDMVERSKPAPDIFIAAAGALGLLPGQCAAVEDSYNGVSSAAAAGCVTIMVPDTMPATPAQRALCAAVLPSLAQLPAFLGQF